MLIGIDMGHTITGKGAGSLGILSETKVNREIGNLVIKYLKEQGESVIDCTVDKSENDLYYRVSIANSYPLDLFLSIHLNIGGENGTETYILDYGGKSEMYARRIQEYVYKSCMFKDRGVSISNSYVLTNTKAPAVLIKVFFLDSYIDVCLYDADKIAKAIVKGIIGREIE